MAPTIHLVRHAQGFHNLSVANEAIRDPLLTDLGKEQCAALRASFPYHDKLTHLVASPMRRTLYTCLEAFGTPDHRLKIVALPEIQEMSDAPCDTGSDPAVLRREFGEDVVDFSRVPDDWTDKSETSPWAPEFGKLEARARKARLFLKELVKGEEDAHVAVVTHGGVVHFLTEDWSGIEPHRATGWENAECRSYHFVEGAGDNDADAHLVETRESLERRNGSTTPLTEAEQREFQAIYYKTWGHHMKWSSKSP